VLKIEDETAIRVGSVLKTDVPLDKRAYGLTTLIREHIKIDGDKVQLEFIAKGGKHALYDIENVQTKNYLIKRYSQLKAGESLFPNVNADQINDHIRDIAGEYLKFHDFRGYHGTRIATSVLSRFAGQTLSAEQKTELVRDVCNKVSSFLHNTPKVAFESYIDPKVWDMIGGIDKDVKLTPPKKKGKKT
jgi:DNA topoisomerase-1